MHTYVTGIFTTVIDSLNELFLNRGARILRITVEFQQALGQLSVMQSVAQQHIDYVFIFSGSYQSIGASPF